MRSMHDLTISDGPASTAATASYSAWYACPRPPAPNPRPGAAAATHPPLLGIHVVQAHGQAVVCHRDDGGAVQLLLGQAAVEGGQVGIHRGNDLARACGCAGGRVGVAAWSRAGWVAGQRYYSLSMAVSGARAAAGMAGLQLTPPCPSTPPSPSCASWKELMSSQGLVAS